ncbi:hypothetical protein EDB86DRAFT_3086016 [Lactarius hatsudake]|nr:hypothetical protein EDB86DRAFT_3086016 [Lactarius hatsudake]
MADATYCPLYRRAPRATPFTDTGRQICPRAALFHRVAADASRMRTTRVGRGRGSTGRTATHRPLPVVDSGHGMWLEFVRAADDAEGRSYERERKRDYFVSSPGVQQEDEGYEVRSGVATNDTRMLAIPKKLELHDVEATNIDRSQVPVTPWHMARKHIISFPVHWLMLACVFLM